MSHRVRRALMHRVVLKKSHSGDGGKQFELLHTH